MTRLEMDGMEVVAALLHMAQVKSTKLLPVSIPLSLVRATRVYLASVSRILSHGGSILQTQAQHSKRLLATVGVSQA